MENVTEAALFVGVFVPFFAAFIVIWFGFRHGTKRNYLLRSARKYSVSPLFGQSRLTLLREAQKPRI
jgi:hypothetical protein